MRLRVEVSGGVVVFSGCGGGLGPQLACWQWLPLGAGWLAGWLEWAGLGWAGREEGSGTGSGRGSGRGTETETETEVRAAVGRHRWECEGGRAEDRGQGPPEVPGIRPLGVLWGPGAGAEWAQAAACAWGRRAADEVEDGGCGGCAAAAAVGGCPGLPACSGWWRPWCWWVRAGGSRPP